MTDLLPFNPLNWFWIVGGDESRWWSSSAGAYVSPMQDFLDAGGAPSRAASEEELTAALAGYGLIGPYKRLEAYAAAKRFAIETGGLTVGGATVQTDRPSQAMITGAYAYAQANPSATIDFKAVAGWVSLSAAQMTAIGLAVGAHVQACFAAEAAIDADIASDTITTTAQIEADGRWP